ncbi:MAG: hypothetical protein SCJ97_02250 [Bacillota bacterium]|nr:hypothetical protein [Bacillota bacterium]
MDILEKDYAAGLFEKCDPPCLSLYQPTHRHYPDNQSDLINYRNLTKVLEATLLQNYTRKEVQLLLTPFLGLADNREFWNHTLNGLAVLGSRGFFRVYRLQRTVAELAIVAERFHIKPLMRILQTTDRYHVLGINRHEIRLFEGNRDVLDEIELAEDIPWTITGVLGKELTEPHHNAAPFGSVGGSHGHGGKESEVDGDAERFFRIIDRSILEHYSKPSGLPLILASLPEHKYLFHRVSHNPFLLEEGIDIHPDDLPIDDLRLRAWQVMEPHYRAKLATLAEDYKQSKSKGLGNDDLAQIAKAIVAGRVATLLIESDREIPGRVDDITGDIELKKPDYPDTDDILDDLSSLSLKNGGKVVVLPAESMPVETGIAAIYRY